MDKIKAECPYGELMTTVSFSKPPILSEGQELLDLTPSHLTNVVLTPAKCLIKKGQCTYSGGHCSQVIYVRNPFEEAGETDLAVARIILNTNQVRTYTT